MKKEELIKCFEGGMVVIDGEVKEKVIDIDAIIEEFILMNRDNTNNKIMRYMYTQEQIDQVNNYLRENDLI